MTTESETPIFSVTRLNPEAMRELVRARLGGQVMFSDEVPPHMLATVFSPLLFGALNPPAEVLEKVLGSSEPPEALPDEPPKPVHPGYQDKAGEPPAKPVLGKVPSKVHSDMEWGYLPEEEWEVIRAKVADANQEKIRAWEDASMAWMDAADRDAEARKLVDEQHEQACRDWQEALSKHEEALAERQKLREEWDAKHKIFYEEWVRDVGAVVGNIKDTFPRSINGLPMFHTVQFVHREDWVRIRAAILREQEKAKDIEI